jgi:hypothetical protein
MQRITNQHLERQVVRINTLTGHGQHQYAPGVSPCTPVAGVYGLDWANGGVKLDRMSLEPGCTGASHPLGFRRCTRRELHGLLGAFIAGLEASQGATS